MPNVLLEWEKWMRRIFATLILQILLAEPVALAQETRPARIAKPAQKHPSAIAPEPDTQPGEWKFSISARPGTMLRVCLYRDKSTAGLFSRGNWKAVLNPSGTEQCSDLMAADLKARRLYLTIPDFNVTGGYLAGTADAYCPRNSQYRTYSPCTSAFFVVDRESENYRVLSSSAIKAAIDESGLIPMLEAAVAEELAAKASADRAAYQRAYEEAATLDDIRSFRSKYADNDPDGLIPRLAERENRLEHERQRERFASANTAAEFGAFISEYERSDYEGLIPEARKKLAVAEKRERIEWEKAQRDKENAQQRSRLSGLEAQISACKEQMAMAQAAISREKQIGAVSGYVDTVRLHQAGEMIVICEASIPKLYAEYRKIGGQKALSELQFQRRHE
jgi:hypothetical protein